MKFFKREERELADDINIDDAPHCSYKVENEAYSFDE